MGSDLPVSEIANDMLYAFVFAKGAKAELMLLGTRCPAQEVSVCRALHGVCAREALDLEKRFVHHI